MNINVKQVDILEQLEEFFKACSDRTRLRLLNLLLVEKEVCVYFLVEVLETNQPKISRHLAYLKKAGVVKARKEGLWVYYRLASHFSEQGQRILECLSACFSEIEELEADVRQLRLIGKQDASGANYEPLPEVARAENQLHSEQLEIELL